MLGAVLHAIQVHCCLGLVDRLNEILLQDVELRKGAVQVGLVLKVLLLGEGLLGGCSLLALGFIPLCLLVEFGVLEEVPVCGSQVLLSLLCPPLHDVRLGKDEQSWKEEDGALPTEIVLLLGEQVEYHVVCFLSVSCSTLESPAIIFLRASYTVSVSFFF